MLLPCCTQVLFGSIFDSLFPTFPRSEIRENVMHLCCAKTGTCLGVAHRASSVKCWNCMEALPQDPPTFRMVPVCGHGCFCLGMDSAISMPWNSGEYSTFSFNIFGQHPQVIIKDRFFLMTFLLNFLSSNNASQPALSRTFEIGSGHLSRFQ